MFHIRAYSLGGGAVRVIGVGGGVQRNTGYYTTTKVFVVVYSRSHYKSANYANIVYTCSHIVLPSTGVSVIFYPMHVYFIRGIVNTIRRIVYKPGGGGAGGA